MCPFASLIRNKERKQKKKGQRVWGRRNKRERSWGLGRDKRGEERERERERAIIPTAGVLHATADFCRQRILKHKMILYDMLYGVLGSFYLLLSTFYLTFYTPKRRKAECF